MKTEEEISFTVTEVLEWLERLALADGLLSDDEVVVIRRFAEFAGMDAEEIIQRMRLHEKQKVKKVVAVPPNVIKGIEFESHVFDFLNKIPAVKVLSRSADYKLGIGRNMDERSLCPDYCLLQSIGRFTVRYWVECKYRSSFFRLSLPSYQLSRYLELQKEDESPVFIVLGIGGTSACPSHIYMMPVDEIVNGTIGFLRKDKDAYGLKFSEMDDYLISLNELDSCILKYFGIK